MPQEAQPFATFQVEHIIPKQHGRPDEEGNLCLASERCNGFKGQNLTAIDPETGLIERLIHPRLQG